MLSKDLEKQGFVEWLPFTIEQKSCLLGKFPNSDGAYVIRSSQCFGRFKGQSDIIYIGSSAGAKRGLRGRLSFFFDPGPSQYTSKRIKMLLDRAVNLEISFRICPAVQARQLEKDILEQYTNEHWELPPYNRSLPRESSPQISS